MDDIKVSKMWKNINEFRLNDELLEDLTNFRSSDVNYTLSLWDPEVNGIRYYKTMLYNMGTSMTEKQKNMLLNIENRNYGNPLSVNLGETDLCLDYYQAVLETEFILDNLDLKDKKILEIGAGYGRTAHSILGNSQLLSYDIVDFGKCLELSKKYLQKVLDEDSFKKTNFYDISSWKDVKKCEYDLVLNIDSFAEMGSDVVEEYLSFIDNNAKNLYVKNPLGKYDASCIGACSVKSEEVSMAISTGLLRNSIDIFSKDDIKKSVGGFLEAYRPSEKWDCSSDARAYPWSYYWQAFFKKVTY